MEMLYLSRQDVEKVNLPMADIIGLLELAFREKGAGRVEMPPKPGIHPAGDAFIHAMPCHIPALKAAGVKWIGGFPRNQEIGLPYISGLMILNDPFTGIPLAVMDCTWVTAKRTGAATALAARYLANPGSEVLGILGCGVQGESNLEALAVVMPHLQMVKAYDIVPGKAQSYIEKMKALHPGLQFVTCRSPRDAVTGCDLVVTAGPILKNPDPVIEDSWFKEGAFASPVDFDCYWKKSCLEKVDQVFTDDVAQLNYYRSVGYFQNTPAVAADLGSLAAGTVRGRENPKQRIVCLNLGLALDDMATGIRVYQLALQKGIGTTLPL